MIHLIISTDIRGRIADMETDYVPRVGERLTFYDKDYKIVEIRWLRTCPKKWVVYMKVKL